MGMMIRHGVALCLALVGAGAQAHEFWIEPQDYAINAGDDLVAQIFVGEDFQGREQSYLPRNFQEFTLSDTEGTRPVEMMIGDRPALRAALDQEGVTVVGYISNPMRVIYQDIEKFTAFLADKDFSWALAAHEARGLSTDRIAEAYVRYGKSLIEVGPSGGTDQDLGYEIELIAQTPLPFETGEVVFELSYQDAPQADTQITVWRKAAQGAVSHDVYRTDAQGLVHVPVTSEESYLVDAVIIRPLEPATQRDPTWETLWASITFAVR